MNQASHFVLRSLDILIATYLSARDGRRVTLWERLGQDLPPMWQRAVDKVARGH